MLDTLKEDSKKIRINDFNKLTTEERDGLIKDLGKLAETSDVEELKKDCMNLYKYYLNLLGENDENIVERGKQLEQIKLYINGLQNQLTKKRARTGDKSEKVERLQNKPLQAEDVQGQLQGQSDKPVKEKGDLQQELLAQRGRLVKLGSKLKSQIKFLKGEIIKKARKNEENERLLTEMLLEQWDKVKNFKRAVKHQIGEIYDELRQSRIFTNALTSKVQDLEGNVISQNKRIAYQNKTIAIQNKKIEELYNRFKEYQKRLKKFEGINVEGRVKNTPIYNNEQPKIKVSIRQRGDEQFIKAPEGKNVERRGEKVYIPSKKQEAIKVSIRQRGDERTTKTFEGKNIERYDGKPYIPNKIKISVRQRGDGQFLKAPVKINNISMKQEQPNKAKYQPFVGAALLSGSKMKNIAFDSESLTQFNNLITDLNRKESKEEKQQIVRNSEVFEKFANENPGYESGVMAAATLNRSGKYAVQTLVIGGSSDKKIKPFAIDLTLGGRKYSWHLPIGKAFIFNAKGQEEPIDSNSREYKALMDRVILPKGDDILRREIFGRRLLFRKEDLANAIRGYISGNVEVGDFNKDVIEAVNSAIEKRLKIGNPIEIGKLVDRAFAVSGIVKNSIPSFYSNNLNNILLNAFKNFEKVATMNPVIKVRMREGPTSTTRADAERKRTERALYANGRM